MTKAFSISESEIRQIAEAYAFVCGFITSAADPPRDKKLLEAMDTLRRGPELLREWWEASHDQPPV